MLDMSVRWILHLLYKGLFLNHKKLQIGMVNSDSLACENRETVKRSFNLKTMGLRETNRKLLNLLDYNCTGKKKVCFL